jgi:hypothetical protein
MMLLPTATFALATHPLVVAAAHLLLGGILTLVVPLVVLIAIAIWYVRIWRGDIGQR